MIPAGELRKVNLPANSLWHGTIVLVTGRHDQIGDVARYYVKLVAPAPGSGLLSFVDLGHTVLLYETQMLAVEAEQREHESWV